MTAWDALRGLRRTVPSPNGSSALRPLAATAGAGVASQAALLVSGILVARALGVENRGHLALITVVAAGLAFLGSGGVPTAVAYYVARRPAAAGRLLRRLLAPAVAQTAAVLIVHGAATALLVRDDAGDVRLGGLIMLAWAPGAVAHMYGLAVLQGLGRFSAFNTIRLAPVLTYAVAVAVAVALGMASLPAIAAAWVGSYLAFGALALVAAGRAARGLDGDAPPLREVVGFGLRGFTGQVSFVETFRLDQLIVGLFLSPAALGLYAVASAFTTLPRVVGQSVGIVAQTRVAMIQDLARARAAARRYLLAAVAACAVVVVVLEALLAELVPLLFGDPFAPATTTARILLVGSLFLAARKVASDGARSLGDPAAASYAELGSWLAFVPLVALLTPWGIEGVALALSVSAAAGLALLLRTSRLSRLTSVAADP